MSVTEIHQIFPEAIGIFIHLTGSIGETLAQVKRINAKSEIFHTGAILTRILIASAGFIW